MSLQKQENWSFWHFQITGWVLLEALSLSRSLFHTFYFSPDKVNPSLILESFSFYIFCDFVAMMVTVGMRYIYRPVFRTEPSPVRLMSIILGVSLVASLLSNTFDYYVSQLLPMQKEVFPKGFISIIYSTLFNVMVFVSWSVLYFGIKFWRQWQFEKHRAERAAYMAQTAQLQMLRYQLNPHFLFNSLNSVSALIDEDRKASKEMLREIADFLRYSLISRNFSIVPLREELEAIQLYLSIEKKRFEDKLIVTYNIDSEATEFPVLSFILHPLIENAIKYGMKTSPLPLRINVAATLDDNRLTLQVENSGSWIDKEKSTGNPGTGVGLKNVEQRLANTYPGKATLQVTHGDGRVLVSILIEVPDHGITTI